MLARKKNEKMDDGEKKDLNVFYLNLLTNDSVNSHTIFTIPVNGILGGIGLNSKTHKSSRIDFYNFFEDYDMVYKPPKTTETIKKITSDIKKRKG